MIGAADKIVDITVAIDKLDKIGLDNVNAELKAGGLSDEAVARLQPIISLSGTNKEKLAVMKDVLAESETGLKGIAECEFVLDTLSALGLRNAMELDLTLARAELLHRLHFRGESFGCGNRQHHRRRPL